jgi:hypothetical protein
MKRPRTNFFGDPAQKPWHFFLNHDQTSLSFSTEEEGLDMKAKAKAKKAVAAVADEEEERDEREEEQEEGAAVRTERDTTRAVAEMQRMLLTERADLAATYTIDKSLVSKLTSLELAQNGVTALTTCPVCNYSILGSGSVMRLDAQRSFVHAECFTCTHQDNDTRCARSPYVVGSDESECYVGSDGRAPVCARHVDLLNLQIPVFDAVGQSAEKAEFFSRRGFVIVRSTQPPSFWDGKAKWVCDVLGFLAAWKEEDTTTKINEVGWDMAVNHLPGIKLGFFGLTGSVKGSKDDYAADIIQCDEAWQMREAAFPCGLDLILGDGSTGEEKGKKPPNLVAGMGPLLVVPMESGLMDVKVQAIGAEKRYTHERTSSEETGRAKAMYIINGFAMVTDCEGSISVLVAPQAWQEEDGSFMTFEQAWENIEPRQYASGQFPADHFAGPLMTPLRLERGQVVLWKGARPFCLKPGPANVFGALVNVQTSMPKEDTKEDRADAVVGNYVTKRKGQLFGFRYLEAHAATKTNIPRNFGHHITPLTMHTVTKYPSLIFGTNYAHRKGWPKKYNLAGGAADSKMDSDDKGTAPIKPKRSIPEALAKEKLKRDRALEKGPAPEVIAQQLATGPEHIAVRKAEQKVTKAAKRVVAMSADGDSASERGREREPEEDQEEAPQQEDIDADETAAPVTKKRNVTTPAKPESPYGVPTMDPEDAIRANLETRLPVQLFFRPDWITDEETSTDVWASLWRTKGVSNEGVFYAGDRFNLGCTVLLPKTEEDTRFELFNPGTEFDLTEAAEFQQSLAECINEMMAQPRRKFTIGNKAAIEGRIVRTFGHPVKMGNETFKPADEAADPMFVTRLLHACENASGEAPAPNRLVMVAIDKRTEMVNPIVHADVDPTAPCYVFFVGGTGRVFRVRTAGVKKEGTKSKSKGAIVGDFDAHSGMGVVLPGDFFTKASIEVPPLSGNKGDAELPTTPFALIVVSTCVQQAQAKKKTKAKAPPAKKAASTGPVTNGGMSVDMIRQRLTALTTEHAERIKVEKALAAKKKIASDCLFSATKSGSAASLKEAREAFENLYEAVTGEAFELHSAADVKRKRADADQEDQEEEEAAPESDDEEAPAPRPLAKAPPKKAAAAPPQKAAAAPAPAKKPATKSTKEAAAAVDKDIHAVPEHTRKAVVTETGKVAVRSLRQTGRTTQSNADVIKEQSEKLMEENYRARERARKRKCEAKHITYIPISFATYRKRHAAGDLSADEEGSDDDGDDEEFHVGDEIAMEMGDEEERNALQAGDSGDEDDEDGDDDEEDEVEDPAVTRQRRLDLLEGTLDALYTPNHGLIDGPKRSKQLGDLYQAACDELGKCRRRKGKVTDEQLDVFEGCYKKLKAAIEAKRPAPKPAAPSARAPAAAVLVDEESGLPLVVEGFAPGVDVDITGQLFEVQSRTILAWIRAAHHLPGFETGSNMDQFLIRMTRRFEALLDSTKPLKQRITEKAVTELAEAAGLLCKQLDKVSRMTRTPVTLDKKAPAPAPAPAPAVVIIEDEEDEQPQPPQEGVPDAEPMDESDGESPGEEPEPDMVPDGEPEGDDEEEADDNAPDAGAEGSAQEATKDKAVVELPKKLPAKVPVRTESLDIVPEKPVITAAPSGGGAMPPPGAPNGERLFAAISTISETPTIYKVGASEDDVRYLVKKAAMPGADINTLFRFRQLPANWKQTVQQQFHQQPVPASLMGKKETQIWKE